MSLQSVRTRVGKYELGRTLGEGTFAKVKFAKNVETGESVAIKVLDKEKLLKHKMVEQGSHYSCTYNRVPNCIGIERKNNADMGTLTPIKREISTMKLIKHPNVVQMHEVVASKTKIYIVLDFVTGGELFDKIVNHGRLKEDEARRYFQQLINAVDYCHSRGVYHRDLKPENLLLDAYGNLKVSDFGLSALPQQVREDGLLHTTCGTPNYVAPEVINDKGYDGATADLWSCGVILFVLMAGYLPFDESNLMTLYRKIYKAEFTCPSWFSSSVKKLITRILDPNPKTRITIPEILENEWFKKGYKPPKFQEEKDVNMDDVDAVFNDSEEHLVTEKKETQPVLMNAFELISMSQGLNLGNLFEKHMLVHWGWQSGLCGHACLDCFSYLGCVSSFPLNMLLRELHRKFTWTQSGGLVKRETRFTSKHPAKEIISKIEEAAQPLGFNVQKQNYKMKLQGAKTGRKGHLSIATEVFEVAPSLFMVEVRKAGGDTLEFHKFYKNLSSGLKDIIWKSEVNLEDAK
eukprot:Gb_31411 [translate_table: standard]